VIPYKVFDALAVGKPVLTADTPAIREALVPGQDVVTCPSGNGAALAEAIEALGRDPEHRRAIAENGHRVFRVRFSLDAITRDLVTMVSELVGGGSAASVPR
jgi:glycosyltransferase involved in cell wall biosynthesis